MEIKINDEIELEITGYSHEGEGIARLDKLVVFVKNALKGEKVIARISQVKKKFAKALAVDIIERSPDRVEVDKGIYAGCNLSHASYDHQLEIKDEIVRNAIQKIAGLDFDIPSILPSKKKERYRNKGHFQVRQYFEEVQFGFFEEGSYDFIRGEDSILYSEKVNKVIKDLEEIIKEEKIQIYDEKRKRGNLRNLFVRESSLNGDIMLVFVTYNEKALPDTLINKIVERHPEVKSIYMSINQTPISSRLGRKNILLYGNKKITDRIGKYRFKLSPNTFFQINTDQTEVLYDKALEFLAAKEGEVIVDAYGGIGTIGIYLGQKAKEVISIEMVKEAKEDGEESARLNHVENMRFITGKVEQILPRMVKKGDQIDSIILDPPRAGCKPEVLYAIGNAKVPKIVYVSCNPGTLARDLKILMADGYKLEQIQPVDMFSCTSHVETIVQLQKVVR